MGEEIGERCDRRVKRRRRIRHKKALGFGEPRAECKDRK